MLHDLSFTENIYYIVEVIEVISAYVTFYKNNQYNENVRRSLPYVCIIGYTVIITQIIYRYVATGKIYIHTYKYVVEANLFYNFSFLF